jgi:hypothetical protein
MSEDPKGVDCECGHHTPFGGYVWAHWNHRLTHTCTACGAKHTIFRGKIVSGEPTKEPTT